MSYAEHKKMLVGKWLGSPPSWWRPLSWLDYKFSAWVLKKCIGDGTLPGEYVFLRCVGCGNIRTAKMRGISASCKCGARKSNSSIGNVTTFRALWALVRGY